jgi:hypothetical protein
LFIQLSLVLYWFAKNQPAEFLLHQQDSPVPLGELPAPERAQRHSIGLHVIVALEPVATNATVAKIISFIAVFILFSPFVIKNRQGY